MNNYIKFTLIKAILLNFEQLKNNPYFKFFSNKYFLIALFFVVWMLFLDSNSWLIHRELNEELIKLEENKEYYKKEIAKDEALIQKLEDSAGLEKFAREKYFMKKENEDVYIIDYLNNDK